MAVVATGFFDGVHLGHRSVIRQLVGEARSRGVRSVAVTFSPHPRAVLQQDAPALRLLTSFSEKRQMLLSLGVDSVEVIPFTREFASLTAAEYISDYLVGRLGCTAMVFGYDNRVGSDGADAGAVRKIASQLGVEIIPTEAFGQISSTKIRAALSEGRVEDAGAMLGYDYFLNGVVVEGNRIGRRLGFPTANMQLYEPLKMIPENGVYLVRVELPSVPEGIGAFAGESYPTGGATGFSAVADGISSGVSSGIRAGSPVLYGMCNIGSRPTVNSGTNITIETNIFNFNRDIYGLPLRISFLRRLRSEVKFDSVEALSAQLTADRHLCETLVADLA